MKQFKVSFYLEDSAYITALRLAAGAVCAAHDIDVDYSEDFKVCVTESIIILKNCGYERAEVVFDFNEGLICTVQGLGGSPKECENEFSLALISALVDDCAIENSGAVTKRITLKL